MLFWLNRSNRYQTPFTAVKAFFSPRTAQAHATHRQAVKLYYIRHYYPHEHRRPTKKFSVRQTFAFKLDNDTYGTPTATTAFVPRRQHRLHGPRPTSRTPTQAEVCCNKKQRRVRSQRKYYIRRCFVRLADSLLYRINGINRAMK